MKKLIKVLAGSFIVLFSALGLWSAYSFIHEKVVDKRKISLLPGINYIIYDGIEDSERALLTKTDDHTTVSFVAGDKALNAHFGYEKINLSVHYETETERIMVWDDDGDGTPDRRVRRPLNHWKMSEEDRYSIFEEASVTWTFKRELAEGSSQSVDTTPVSAPR